MKKNIYSLFLAVIALATFTACSDSDNDYQWASVPGNAQVYFSSDLPSKQNISNKKNSFTVPVSRVKTTDAISVGISITSDDDFFTAPSSVSFNAGEATADLTISYDGSALEYDDYKSIKLSISDEGYTTPYGASTYTFKVGAPSPFKSIGKGTMVENYLWGFSTPVEILQSEENPYIYRVQNGYALKVSQDGDDPSEYIEITLLQPGETIYDVPITMEDLVYFSPTSTGNYYDDGTYTGTIWLYHPAHFGKLATEDNFYYSRVLGYKEDGTPGQIQLAPRYHIVPAGVGYSSYNKDDVCVITFPGFVPKDYSADIAANGIFTDFAGNVYASAIAEFGADATNVKAVVVPVDADPDAVADALASGDIEGEVIDTNSSTIEVPIEEGLSGKLMIVLVVLDEANAIKGTYVSAFEYYGGSSNPWQSIGIGLYSEDFISSVYGVDAVQYEVEIEENTEHPGLYRMVNPYDGKFPYNEEGDWDADGTYNIEVNAEDPEGVYISLQATGVNWGDGPISIVSWGAFNLGDSSFEELKEAGFLGTLKDGIITLPVFDTQMSDGSTLYYQGLTVLGSNAYYGCQHGEFALILPEAMTETARAKARANVKARNFAKRLYGNNKGFSMKQIRTISHKKAPLSKALTITK